MTTPVVLVPLDGTAHTLVALPVARALAAIEGATVLAIHVTEKPLPAVDFMRETGLERDELRNMVVEIRPGNPAGAILEMTHETPVAAIVLCAHTASPTRAGVMGTAERVLRGTRCPVVVVRPTLDVSAWSLKRILLPHDGTPSTSAAIGPAFTLAQKADARLDVLHVADTGAVPSLEPGSMRTPSYVDQRQYEWPAWASEFLDRLACTCPAPSRVPELRLSLARGEPASEIVRFAAENSIDLIVLAWSGTLEPDRALAARGVLRNAPCPVMVLRTEPEAKAG